MYGWYPSGIAKKLRPAWRGRAKSLKRVSRLRKLPFVYSERPMEGSFSTENLAPENLSVSSSRATDSGASVLPVGVKIEVGGMTENILAKFGLLA